VMAPMKNSMSGRAVALREPLGFQQSAISVKKALSHGTRMRPAVRTDFALAPFAPLL
jgi:hypothetical protein